MTTAPPPASLWPNPALLPPLFRALNDNDAERVRAVLAERPEAVTDVDAEKRTALHWACSARPALVVPLLEAGADPALADDAGWSCFHVAAAARSDGAALGELVRSAQASRRAERDPLFLKECLNAANHVGATPLILAASKGREANVELLLNSGVVLDVDASDKHGNTAMMRAAAVGHEPTVRALLLRGADLTSRTHKAKQTALHIACAEGHDGIVALLVAHAGRASADVKDADGDTPRDLAPPRLRPLLDTMHLAPAADAEAARDEVGR